LGILKVTDEKSRIRIRNNISRLLNTFLKNPPWNVQQCVVSGSKDCCIKVWNLELGLQLKSIYTFNTITRLQLLPHRLVRD
jgi:hypothetical protein